MLHIYRGKHLYNCGRCVLTIYIITSRHTVVCHAAQEAGTPHREYINRKKENVIVTPL